MFDSKHYVPILKWKSAEQQALDKLNAEDKKVISPLIQLVMPQPKQLKRGQKEKTRDELLKETVATFKSKIPQIPGEIIGSWGTDPAFIDFSLIYTPSLRVEGLNQILTTGEELGLFLIPVINLSSDRETIMSMSSLVKKYKRGICLRLVHADFTDPEVLFGEIQNVLKSCGLSEKDADLLIDLQDMTDEYYKLMGFSQTIPNLSKWRTFIFACGAFPVDLSKCKLGENYISRFDWISWVNQRNSKKLLRTPSFADYTIQHPIYKESYQFFSPSASIRYTLRDNWLVMRGQKGKNVQYLANARLLSQASQFKKIFFGANFSFGDTYISEKGKDLNGRPGNATTWLVAGINHHLACTVDQIANLS